MPIKHYFFQSLYKILLRLYHGQQRESRCAAKHPPLTSDLFPLLGLVWSERQCSRRRWCPLAANYQSVTWFSLYFSAKTEHQLHRHPSEVIIILAFFSLPVTFLSVSVSDGRPSGGTHLTQATEPRQKVRWSVGIICAGRSPSLTPDITSDLFGRVNCSALSGDLSHLMLCWPHESRSIEQIFHNLPIYHESRWMFHNLPSFLRLKSQRRCDIQHTAEIKYAALAAEKSYLLLESWRVLQSDSRPRLWPDIYQIFSELYQSQMKYIKFPAEHFWVLSGSNKMDLKSTRWGFFSPRYLQKRWGPRVST